MNVFLYGPPGSGKSTLGRMLAARLGRPLVDVDAVVAARSGKSIAQVFREDGEPAFRRIEADVCRETAGKDGLVVALGAGALMDRATRAAVERRHLVVSLDARPETLLARLNGKSERPLLNKKPLEEALRLLLQERAGVYGSFTVRVGTDDGLGRAAENVASLLEKRVLQSSNPRIGHAIHLGYGLLEELLPLLEGLGLRQPFWLVTDENVARALEPGLPHDLPRIVVPPGERSKNLRQVGVICERLVDGGMDRSGTIVAVGGGVVSDLAGFAAATFMRGVRWAAVPTTLLAMIDASIGGKTGVDLQAGKNMIGAFHPPELIVADPLALGTLPEVERVSGMAEVVKHAIIGNTRLFERLEQQHVFGSLDDLENAMRVKTAIVDSDPFDRGEREVLNLGHTVGHAVESASGYSIRHGEAVSIGLVAEAIIAEEVGVAGTGLADRLSRLLASLGLPTSHQTASPERLRRALWADKKKTGKRLRFVLPSEVGRVLRGVEVPDEVLDGAIARLCG
jgi:shikimate kinase / 3-dehydroquinate synthase